jgi:rubrerythrin
MNMHDNIFTCENCNTEYEIVHDEDEPPEYCPFCGWKNMESEEIEEEWEH